MMANEVRLIDANALEKDMRAYADNKAYCGHIELANGIVKAVGRIDLAPTIDPETLRPKGRWVMKEAMIRSPYAKNAYCSECLEETSYAHKFCPNCGADMRGEVDDKTNGVTFAKDTDVPSKWVSVEDEPPKESDADAVGRVWAKVIGEQPRACHWTIVADFPEDFTHWMPLPEPPADGEGGKNER